MEELSSIQRYAAGALLALALREAQVYQLSPVGFNCPSDDEDGATPHATDIPQSELWINERFGLLRPVFRYLKIDDKAWPGLEETAMTFPARHHIGAFLRILSEEEKDEPSSSEGANSETELANAIDAVSTSFERTPLLTGKSSRNYGASKTQRAETNDDGDSMEGASKLHDTIPDVCQSTPTGQNYRSDDNETITEGKLLTNQRKVAVLFELLAACVADTYEEKKKKSVLRKGYDARHRVSLRLLATWLDIKWSKVAAMELMVACSAMAALKEKEAQEQDEKTKGGKWAKWKRGGIIGAAALTGGALLAITGGLAAPAIAAGLTALAPTLGTIVPVIGASGFAAAATAAGSVAGSVAVAASFGAAGAGLTGTKMARRTGGVEEFEFLPIGENHQQGVRQRLAVCILVSGFISEQEDFTRPWEGHDGDLERYAVRWESKNLIILSTAIQDWLTSNITTELMKQGAMLTVLSTLVAAFAWPAALLSATNLIDGNWSIAVDRSDKAGVLLAEVLLKGLQGNRPVTLIGFSLGARMIFKCLQELAKKEESAGIVERVVFLGAPVPLDKECWQTARKMVAGRFVNCYSANDWILGITFRASLLTQGLAGIQPVDIPGIENVDVTEVVDGHSSYLSVASEILKEIELDSFYPVFSAKFHSR